MIDSVEEHKEYVAKCTELNEILVSLDYTRESLNSWFKEIERNGITCIIRIMYSKEIIVSLVIFTDSIGSSTVSISIKNVNELIALENKLYNKKFNENFKYV